MKNLKPFFAGILTTAVIGSLTISALAITERMTITVDPINVQVNGETFQPKDANGNDVPVFVYNGTTYAPLRALAEAYGLEVGYDAETNMATVTDPNTSISSDGIIDHSDPSHVAETTYQKFKEMWDIELVEYGEGPNNTQRAVALLVFHGDLSKESLEKFLNEEVTTEMYTALLEEFTNEDYPLALIRFYYETTETDNEILRVSLYEGKAWIV